MERKVSLHIYVGAFILSLAIFIIGVYIGYLIDSSNLQNINSEIASISDNVSSTEFMLMSEGNSSAFCPVYISNLDAIDQNVEMVGYKLSYLEDEKAIYDNESKKNYFILEGESYLLSEKVKALCGDKSILLINFYSNSNCQTCKGEGTEILRSRDQLAQNGTSIKLFSFDGDLGSPVADAFKAQYNVTSYPTIVINDQTYTGYKTSDQIESIIRSLG